DRVKIDDAKQTFVLVLQRHPVAQRAEIISQMHIAGGLSAAEDSFHSQNHAPIKRIFVAIGMTTLKMILNTPVNIARINRIKPKRSRASNPDSKLGGKMLCKTLLPSSGGIGIRLKTPKATFNVKKVVSNCAPPSAISESVWGIATSR